MFRRTRAQERNRKAAENARAITAGSVGVYSAAVREAFQGLQGDFEDLVVGRTAKARDKASATRVVVRMSPVRLAPQTTHDRVLGPAANNVQCRIFLECIRNCVAV